MQLGMRHHTNDGTVTVEWLAKGEDTFGVKHDTGDLKYTWEVIRDTGLCKWGILA